MKWECWLHPGDPRFTTEEADTAEEAAAMFASWYDQERCNRGLAHRRAVLDVLVAPVDPEPMKVRIRCGAVYHYDVTQDDATDSP